MRALRRMKQQLSNGDAGGGNMEFKAQLSKQIGVIQGIGIIIGMVVGSGIFVSPKGILQEARSVGLSFVMWAVTGLFSTLGAVCYAEIGTTIPRSGGEYIYVMEVMGSAPAFLILWITFIPIGSVGTAANSLLFAKYCLQAFYPGCPVPDVLIRITAFLSISLLCAINSLSVNLATRMSTVISASKISALGLVTALGIYHLFQGRTENFENAFANSDYGYGVVSAFYQGFWAYSGWNYLNFLTEEMKEPARSLPRAIVASLVLVTVIYITANVAYLAVLSPTQLIGSHAVAFTFAEKSMGRFAGFMPLLVAAAIFGSMNCEVLSMSRAALTAAGEGHFPSVLGMISHRWKSPMPSVLFMGLSCIIFQQVFTNQLDYLIELTGFAFMIIILAALGCLLLLRKRRPDIERPLKLPIALPITLFFITAGICVITFLKSPYESLMSVAIMLSGLPFYAVFVLWRSKPASVNSFNYKVTTFLQKLLFVVPPDKSEIEKI